MYGHNSYGLTSISLLHTDHEGPESNSKTNRQLKHREYAKIYIRWIPITGKQIYANILGAITDKQDIVIRQLQLQKNHNNAISTLKPYKCQP